MRYAGIGAVMVLTRLRLTNLLTTLPLRLHRAARRCFVLAIAPRCTTFAPLPPYLIFADPSYSLVNVLGSGQWSEDVVPTVAFNLRQVRKGNITMKIWDVAVSHPGWVAREKGRWGAPGMRSLQTGPLGSS